MAKEKVSKRPRDRMDMHQTITGVDLSDSESLATLLFPAGDVMKIFPFKMDEEGLALFTENVSKDSRIAFEATLMASPPLVR